MPEFSTTTPPLAETYSFFRFPCLWEWFTHMGTVPDQVEPPECPHAPECRATAGNLSSPIRLGYDEMVQVTLAEPSSNIVSRSESQYNHFEYARFSIRKHFYELLSPRRERCALLSDEALSAVETDVKDSLEGRQEDVAEKVAQWLRDLTDAVKAWPVDGMGWRDLRQRVFASMEPFGFDRNLKKLLCDTIGIHSQTYLGCHEIAEDSKFGKYLGFVDVRTTSTRSPIAMGLLVPPRYLRHDPDVYLIAGDYGKLFGAESFASTVFSMHDELVSGARCAQACVIMALAMLADRGVKVIGSYDITYLAKEPEAGSAREHAELTPVDDGCLLKSDGTCGGFRIQGLRPSEIVRVFRSPVCNASADRVELPSNGNTRRLVSRLIEGYLLARYPAILPVDSIPWWKQPAPARGHAVLIVGMRRSCRRVDSRGDRLPRNSITELILQDPGRSPFVKRPIEDCLDANEVYPRTRPNGIGDDPAGDGKIIELIFVAERKIRRHAYDCVRVLLDENRRYPFSERYYCSLENAAGLSDATRALFDTDYRIFLVHRRDLVKTLAIPELDGHSYSDRTRPLTRLGREATRRYNSVNRVKDKIKSLKSEWHWCVAGYHQDKIEMAWLFSVDSENGTDPACWIDFPPSG